MQLVCLEPTDEIHSVPEVRRTELVGHILEHAGNPTLLDLIEDLASELGIISLLINGEGTVPYNCDAVVGGRNEILPAHLSIPGKDRYVRHALKLNAAPVLGVRTAMRPDWHLLLPVPPVEPLGLFTRGLVIIENSVPHDQKVVGPDPFVVVAYGRYRSLLGAVSLDVHKLGSVLELAQDSARRRQKAGSGQVGLIPQRPIELGGMANGFVDREPEMGRVQDEIVLALPNGSGGELLRGFFCPALYVADQIHCLDVLPATARRRSHVPARLKVREISGHCGDIQVGMGADELLG